MGTDDGHSHTAPGGERCCRPNACIFFCGIFIPVLACIALWHITVLYTAFPSLLALLFVVVWSAWFGGRGAPVAAWRRLWRAGSRPARALMVAYVAFVLAISIAMLLYVLSPYAFPHRGLVAARLGAVTSTSLRVWARAPDAAQFGVRYRTEGGAWTEPAAVGASGVALLLADADHTGVAQLTDLSPATRYEYEVVFDGDGTSTPSALSGHFSTLPPEHAPSAVRFVFGSCVMKSETAGYELDGLSDVLAFAPALWLNLGDLIYADVPLSGVGLGGDVGAYRAHYRRTMADAHAAALQRAVPGFFQIDDHEILNDWKTSDGATFAAATRAYGEYAGSLNPGGGASDVAGKVGFYTFVVAHVCVFVADTRTRRGADTILGASQLAAATSWLRATRDVQPCAHKVFASPVPVTQNYGFGAVPARHDSARALFLQGTRTCTHDTIIAQP